ncbi:zwei Ig domain protein zig-4 [Caerostris darwini]|uniref:Zwei Ig domain protein zig-4 n=1 Tax=Caerostris darwini TaxID=1538125 RepID=A0AAV4UK46_9ARAC|nr:zwei Ig domain protein zig-4 [Caerostris darwini]
MTLFNSITFAILIAAPLALSRHVEHSTRRTSSRRHEDVREGDESSWLFPRANLRLHAKPPKVLHTKEGGSEILECQAGGSPRPHIYWLKNGKQLTKDDLADELELNEDNRHKLNMGSTSSRLYLDCLTAGDEAEYTCIAENSHLRESTTTRVTVSSSDDRSCHDKKQFGQAPRIVSWTKTALENQGDDMSVICRAEGQPKPTIKWLDPFKNEIDPERKSRFEIMSNGDLIISNLKWKDMGNYVCVAENTHGSARAEVFVYPAAPET